MPTTLTLIYGHDGSGKHTMAYALTNLNSPYTEHITITLHETYDAGGVVERLGCFLANNPNRNCVAVCDGFIPDAAYLAKQFRVPVFTVQTSKQTP